MTYLEMLDKLQAAYAANKYSDVVELKAKLFYALAYDQAEARLPGHQARQILYAIERLTDSGKHTYKNPNWVLNRGRVGNG